MSLTQQFNVDGSFNIGTAGSVSTAAPTYTTGAYAPLSLTTTGLLRVDGSGVTQPVSATSLPLPTGASTSALQTTGNSTLSTISGQLPASLGIKVSASSLSVVIASDQVVPVSFAASTTGGLTSITASVTTGVLLASNTSRKGVIIFNDSTSILYVALSATSSATAYSSKMFPQSQLTLDTIYTGVISGIWVAANGAAKITELT